MIVLGIETSCDETAASVWAHGRVASSVVASQVPLHARYGGVVPELASRAHEEKMWPVLAEALAAAGTETGDLQGVAVTNRPGLIGSLLVGLAAAKAVALARGLPLVGVDHLEAHLHALELSGADPSRPWICLLVSGGHTALYRWEGAGGARLLGATTDDAAGEAFDKVAKLLGLPYPGGPAIEAAAARGDPGAFDLPVARVKGRPLDFSFSGLKTAVLYRLRDRGVDARAGSAPSAALAADMAASFQRAAVRALVEKVRLAARTEGVGRVALAGGVALNRALRSALDRLAAEEGWHAAWPEDGLCGDNAAMVASLGARLLRAGEDHGLGLDARARVLPRRRGGSRGRA